MIVTISGIKRSGSTAQYNLTRLILESKYDINIFGHEYEIVGGVSLIKRHDFDPFLYQMATHILTTDRPDEDIKASFERLGWKYKKSLSNMRHELELWKRKSLHQEFDDIVNNPIKCIEEIANYLNIEVNPLEIYDKFKEIKPREEYDPKTMLLPNHIK